MEMEEGKIEVAFLSALFSLSHRSIVLNLKLLEPADVQNNLDPAV